MWWCTSGSRGLGEEPLEFRNFSGSADEPLVGATLHQALTGIARLTARAGASYESTEHGIAATFGRP
jgi:hypothetical protein